MDKHDQTLEGMAHLMGEMTEAGLAGQAAGLRLLAAEMQALAQLMPGMAVDHPPHQTDAEIEAEFDNMPV